MKNKLLLFVLIALVLANTAVVCFLLSGKRKIGFVDTIRLTQEYEMRKDMERYAESRLFSLKRSTDSLKNVRDLLMREPGHDKERVKVIEMQLYQVTKSLNAAIDQETQAINESIWKRLNTEINLFGKDKKFDIVVGANGMGSVLYGDNAVDYTSELIDYVNKKYKHEK